jgi:hypothetical protein
VALLIGLGLAISKPQVVRLLTAKLEDFRAEDEAVLQAVLMSAPFVTVDDQRAPCRQNVSPPTSAPAGSPRSAPGPEIARGLLRAQFDRVFKRRTGYATLDRLLKRLFGRKDELLRGIERPEIPLNANASENDVRAFVTKRKISGGTASEKGRQARDVMLGLATISDAVSAFPDPTSPNSPPSHQANPCPEICPDYLKLG